MRGSMWGETLPHITFETKVWWEVEIRVDVGRQHCGHRLGQPMSLWRSVEPPILTFIVLSLTMFTTFPLALAFTTLLHLATMDFFIFYFLFFIFESGLLSVEARPYVGLYIRVHYSSGPYASSTSTSPAALCILMRLTPSDRSQCGSSTETLFLGAPFRECASV